MASIARVALAALVALSACAYDPGGPVEWRAAELVADPVSRPITGYCASACTMRLGRDCVTPWAHLVLHVPDPDTPHWRAFMAEYYPPDIADLFMSMPSGFYALTGAEAIRMGATPC
jgi:hypothetical protein